MPAAAAGVGEAGRDRAGWRGAAAAAADGRPAAVRWVRPSYGAVHDFLTNPAYAGAFVFGRTRTEKYLADDGWVRRRTVQVPLEQWSVCIPDHHPGYVSWDEYLAGRERLRANVIRRGEGGGAAALRARAPRRTQSS